MCSELPNMTTLRINLKTEPIDLKRLKTLATQFGNQIESFHWDFCEVEVDAADFSDMLAPMVNLKVLTVYNVTAGGESAVAILNLANLTSLSCYCNDSNIQNIVLKIKSKNLQRFTMFSNDCHCSFNVNRFLRRNKSLKKLSLYGNFKNLYALRHLKSLQNLYVEQCLDNDNTFNAICGLNDLRFLDISVENVSSCVITNLQRLNNLTNLVLRSDYDVTKHFEQLTTTNIPNLKSLQLDLGNISTSEEVLAKFGSTYHQLEKFEITFSENRNVYDFLESLKNVKNLSINFEFQEDYCDSLSNYFAGMQSQIDETNLRVLSLNFIKFHQNTDKSNNDNILLKIVNFLPRLKALSVQGIEFSFDEVLLENLLNVWHRIKELDLSFTSTDCKDFDSEFTAFHTLTDLLEEFSLSLIISLQCMTHFEKFKASLSELESKKIGNISLSYDKDYFHVELDKR
jgi:hypothetical protein